MSPNTDPKTHDPIPAHAGSHAPEPSADLPANPELRRQLRLERLQTTLNRAYRNVPFHRAAQNRLAEKTGRDPSVLERMEDIDRLPFLERRDLSANYPYGLFAVPLRDIVRIHTVAGTGGNPAVNGYTRQDLRIWREVVARGLRAAGIGAHDILQISLDPGLANWARDYKDGAESLEAAVIPNTPLSPEKQLMVIRDYKTSVLITTPSEAAELASQLFRSQINPTALSLRILILVGEPLNPDLRAHLAATLHSTIWVHYGLSEAPGPAIAWECDRHQGLHLNDAHFFAEVVDPATGQSLPAGEAGELVLTTLTTRAFPLIRFRTGEGARIIAEPCPCGHPDTRLEWLPDRVDHLLNINGVKVHPDQIEARIATGLGFLPEHRFSVSRLEGRKNRLCVELVMEERLFSDEVREIERKIRDLTEHLRETLGVTVAVRLREPGLLR